MMMSLISMNTNKYNAAVSRHKEEGAAKPSNSGSSNSDKHRRRLKSLGLRYAIFLGTIGVVSLLWSGYYVLNDPTTVSTAPTTPTTPTTTTRSSKAKNKCTGKAWERRALAQRGQNASAEEWRRLAHCLQKRVQRLSSHFVIHVSKSGGSSLCDLFQQKGCNQEVDNCNIVDATILEKETYHAFLGWVRRSALQNETFKLRPFTMLRKTNNQLSPRTYSDPTCAQLADYAVSHNMSMFKVERFLPPAGNHNVSSSSSTPPVSSLSSSWRGVIDEEDSCSNYFWSTMVFREPVDRILSHYNFISKFCYDGLCNRMIQDDNNNNNNNKTTVYFNVSRMLQYFDLISDNHYLRILNGQKSYFLPRSSLEDIQDESSGLLQHAFSVLHDIDWIMLLGRNKSVDESESLYILQNAIGIQSLKSMPHKNAGENVVDHQTPVKKPSLSSLSRRKGFHSNTTNTTNNRTSSDDHHDDHDDDDSNSSMSTEESVLLHTQGQFTPQDRKWLEKLNRLDYILWEEAQRLHDLDVYSLQMLQRHASDIMNPNITTTATTTTTTTTDDKRHDFYFLKKKKKKKQPKQKFCCGRICP